MFSRMDKNTCPGLQKHLTLGGLKLSGPQLHLSCWRTKFFQADLKKKKRNLKNSANPASTAEKVICVSWCVGERMDVSPLFCTAPHGVRVVGPVAGESVLAHDPVLLKAWSTAWPNLFISLFPCLASWTRFALSVPEVFSCLEIKFDYPILFSHHSFDPSHKYLTGRTHGKTRQVCWGSISPLSSVCYSYLFWLPDPAKYILRKISNVKH